MSRPARFGVVGWPVAHSRSPAMHRAAGLDYQRLPVPPALFEDTVRALPAAGFEGVNVTVPHKEAALALADEASAGARAIGAANTLSFAPERGIVADNTDAPGLIASLPLDPAGRTALVLGAGGSARAAAWALREAGASVTVHNRTAERARALADALGDGVTAADAPVDADVLVQCTTVGLDDPDALVLDPGPFAAVVDLVYREGGTALVRAAHAAGIPAVDGLEVLVQQGARSFAIWTGREPNVAAMRAAASDAPS